MTSTPGPGRIGGQIAAVSGLGGIWRSAAAASCVLICEIVRPIWGGHAGTYDSRRAVPFQHHDPRGGQEGRAASLDHRGADITAMVLSAGASPRRGPLMRTPKRATNLPAQRRRVLKCAPAFKAGERSATRLIVDAIARKDLHLESRGRGRPWISPRPSRWHRPPQRCSFCSLLSPALSHHDMSPRHLHDHCDRAVV